MIVESKDRRIVKRLSGAGGLAVVGVAGIALLLFGLSGCTGRKVAAQSTVGEKSGSNGETGANIDPTDDNVITVETIRPKRNPRGFAHSETQPAYVQGLYTIKLMSHVAGTVKFIKKDIGDTVRSGELLVELDAPDLAREVAQKTALVYQAEQDSLAAQVALKLAQASAKTAQSLIKGAEADEAHAQALEEFHAQEFDRYKSLAQSDAVVANVLDEKLRDLEAAKADYKVAQVATATARAKADEFSAKVDAARVDIDVKKARVAVAIADRDYAQSMVNYTKIYAPFDGIVVARHVDPGSFVQNASTGNPTPMLQVVRTDIVTFVTWVPEKDAPLVNKNTRAIIHMDALGDQEIAAKVTRYSHWLDPDKSRDMRVEVDVNNKDGRLSPGMYGSMKLALEDFSKSLLVPDSAVFPVSGHTYIFEVRGGHAVRIPVRVQFEDGVQAKIVKILNSAAPKTGHQVQTYQDLTDHEEIIRSGQGELADGQPVKAIPTDW